MRITEIAIKNYRAFYGEHLIYLDKDGKNLMVYGENGSGKSSLFSALENFMLSSIKKVPIEENIFIPASQKNTASIKLKIQENAKATVSHEYEVKTEDGVIISADKSLIANANKIKGFFDYRSLLRTHLDFVSKDKVDIFNILLDYILPHAENRFTKEEIGKEWIGIKGERELRKGMWRVEWLKTNTDTFTKGLKLLLESIEADTNIFIKSFDKSLSIKIEFDACYYDDEDRYVYGDNAFLKINYAGKDITKHHLFLNEARLSALAISLYLASVKVNPLSGALKLLVLDDLLIGLDMSNRLPLLEILKKYFIEIPDNDRFQIIMTTYDKVWFELVNNYFGTDDWKYVEIYSMKLKDNDFEIPIIRDTKGYLDKARYYLTQKDNKASAVYIRTEFERLVKNLCENKYLPVTYKTKQKEFSTEDFWHAIATQTDIPDSLVKEIEIHRKTVMNPFSHYDLESPEFTKELEDTIEAIEKLKGIDYKLLNKTTFDDLQKRIRVLEHLDLKKNTIIKTLREAYKNKK